jgi:hypothetical protein
VSIGTWALGLTFPVFSILFPRSEYSPRTNRRTPAPWHYISGHACDLRKNGGRDIHFRPAMSLVPIAYFPFHLLGPEVSPFRAGLSSFAHTHMGAAG